MTSCFPVARPLRGVFSRTFALSALVLPFALMIFVPKWATTIQAAFRVSSTAKSRMRIDPYTGNATRTHH